MIHERAPNPAKVTVGGKKRVQSDRRRATSCAPDSPYRSDALDPPKVEVVSGIAVGTSVNLSVSNDPSKPNNRGNHSTTERPLGISMEDWLSNGFQGVPVFQAGGNQDLTAINSTTEPSTGDSSPSFTTKQAKPERSLLAAEQRMRAKMLLDEGEARPRPVVCQTLGVASVKRASPDRERLVLGGRDKHDPDSIHLPYMSGVKQVDHMASNHRKSHGSEQGRTSGAQNSRAMEHDHEDVLLKAITEATERTRRREEQGKVAALRSQAELHAREKEEAIRKAIDDTLISMQDRFHDEPPQSVKRTHHPARAAMSKRVVDKQREELQHHADSLSAQVKTLQRVAADAIDEGKAAKQALVLAQQQLRDAEKKNAGVKTFDKEAKARKKSQVSDKYADIDRRKSEHDTDVLDQIEEFSAIKVERNERVALVDAKQAKMVQAKVEELEEALASKSGEVETANERTEVLTEQLKQATAGLVTKEVALQAAEAKVVSLQAQLNQLDEVNWDLERQLEKVSQRANQLDGKLCGAETELEQVTLRCAESMGKFEQFQATAQAASQSSFEALQLTAIVEKSRREEVESNAKFTTEQLQDAVRAAQEEHAQAEKRAKLEARKSMIADFAQNSVHKQLANTKRELMDLKEKLVKMQVKTKKELELEKTSVSKLQRELASTKKMLQASQRGHKKAPSPNKHIGTSALDVVCAARERIFGRPHEIVTKNGSKEVVDWEDDDIWGLEADLNNLDVPSPKADSWEVELSVSEAIDAELKSTGGILLPPI